MRFGVARDLVTPPMKTHMGGYGSLYGQAFKGVHDDLYVKTLLLDDGVSQSLMITLDLLFHDFDLTEAVADYASETYGVPRENLVLSYTHTHAGPALKGYDPGQHCHAYEVFLLDRVKRCVDRAFVNTFEGTLEYGVIEGRWNCSRRRVIDGKMTNAPNPEGERDPEMAILSVRDAEGDSRVILFNYSCHPVTLGATRWLSGEYPGRTCQLLETAFYGTTALFFQSAGGCSIPVACVEGDTRKAADFNQLAAMCRDMADAVENAVRSGALKPVDLNLAGVRFVVSLETEERPKASFAELADTLPDGPARNEALVVLDRYDRTDNRVNLRAGILRLGRDLYVAWLCGEDTWPVKQHVKKAFGDSDVLFIGYADAIAYIPDDRYISEGGYEVDGSVVEFCLKGRFKPGVDAKMTDGFAAALEKVRL